MPWWQGTAAAAAAAAAALLRCCAAAALLLLLLLLPSPLPPVAFITLPDSFRVCGAVFVNICLMLVERSPVLLAGLAEQLNAAVSRVRAVLAMKAELARIATEVELPKREWPGAVRASWHCG